MEIFIGNLPEHVDEEDVQKLVKNILEQNLFRKLFNSLMSKGDLDKRNASYRVIKKESHGIVKNFAHVGIQSEKLAKCIIDSVGRIRYRGQSLVAREYKHRAYINDRRDVSWRECPWSNDERRLFERRHSQEYFWGL